MARTQNGEQDDTAQKENEQEKQKKAEEKLCFYMFLKNEWLLWLIMLPARKYLEISEQNEKHNKAIKQKVE